MTKQRPPKNDPLLPTSIKVDRRVGTSICARCTLITSLSIPPILSCSLTLSTLYLLLHNMNITPDAMSISAALADYEPIREITVLLVAASFAGCIVIVSRSVQIDIYHRRNESSSIGLTILNIWAALCQILGYVGLVLLSMYSVDGDLPQRHLLGVALYLGLSSVYGFFHTILLWNQREYPVFSKVILTMVPLASISCSVMFAIVGDGGYQLEWIAVILQSLFIGLFTLLFVVDIPLLSR